MDKIEEKIRQCNLCGELQKLDCNTIKYGNSNILIIGESPAKDGWINSKRAFYNTNNKLQATGRVLDKLLALINLSIDDINFTECCKCLIADRKNLPKCAENCKPILFKQISESKCDYILPMGVFVTQTLLGIKVLKMKDYVGKKFYIDFLGKTKTVIPIYHTSPLNPLSYKGNEDIFNSLKNENIIKIL